MNQPLIVRYTSNWPSRFDPAAELFYEGPRRQRQLIALAQQQLEGQKVAAREIASSNLAGAEMVVNSINQQSEVLASAIGEMGIGFSRDIAQAANDISDSIAYLGDRICASLDEIRWQLAQTRKVLDGILATLLDSRNNEAKQLVRQGLRHFNNGEFTEAEERFKRALDFDSIDYQVLLNLAFIEIHRDDAVQACGHFQKPQFWGISPPRSFADIYLI